MSLRVEGWTPEKRCIMTRGERDALILGGLGLGAWLLLSQLRKNKYDFHDKAVLITGGSRGLGLVAARKLTERGARLAIWARDGDELNRAADDLELHGAASIYRVLRRNQCPSGA